MADDSSSREDQLRTDERQPNGVHTHTHTHEHGHDETEASGPITDATFQLTVTLPHPPYKTQTIISTQDQAQELKQSIIDVPHTFQYSCFHLEADGERIPEFVDLGQVEGVFPDAELALVEDPYTEKDARMHFLRVRELIGAASTRTDIFHGIQAGLSIHDVIAHAENILSKSGADRSHALNDFNPDTPGSLSALLENALEDAPRTTQMLSVSSWNPPPYHLRTRGHLLYLQLTTLEGEQYQITAHVSGFYINKSTVAKFDPAAKSGPKACKAHSLLSLISSVSPAFENAFKALQEFNARKDPLSSFQLTNAIPVAPWTVSPSSTLLANHESDITRNQESYLMSGADNAETLRDWNEEFQTTRELPRDTVQDRVFRERLTSKLFAEYNDAAAAGAVLIARGEVASLNATEPPDAQIFVYNNIFYSFGADGVGTFESEGGNEAARVAVGKDVMGVKAVNQADIQDLATPGTVVVDYMGKRIVCQSIVPGIFKQREEGEHQIDYGGVEGKDEVADNAVFAPLFEKLSKALHVKQHPVWDKENKRHDLETSIETKGLLGTDGRKYALDLYRITPIDFQWIEEHWTPFSEETSESKDARYPHRMTVFRSELVDAYWRTRVREYVKNELARRRSSDGTKAVENGSNGEDSSNVVITTNGDKNEDSNGTTDLDKEIDQTELVDSAAATAIDTGKSASKDQEVKDDDAERVDISGFVYALNPDVFSGQEPQTDDEKAAWAEDEDAVRGLSKYLLGEVLPRMVQDLQEGDVGFPMDGLSLSNLLHKRGVNIRYLGKIAELADKPDPRLSALKALCEQEMIARSFKHVANHYLQHLSAPFSTSCVAHLLNCFLGSQLNEQPSPQVDEELRKMYTKDSFDFEKVTPNSLHDEVETQVKVRYRHSLAADWLSHLKSVQMLREISLKLGLQVAAKEYRFTKEQPQPSGDVDSSNGIKPSPTNGQASNVGKRKKKAADAGTPTTNGYAGQNPSTTLTFSVDDIYNVVPVIKEASPRSVPADEALEAGRISMAQNQRELGQELLLESLSLHEQVYGILHAEVARVYYQLSSFFYSLDDKPIAVELARKAVIVSERTLGIDHHETILAYLNLGLFEHGAGNTYLALTYIRHALELWKVVYGPNHPDSITTLNNAAVMLQGLKLYHDSRVWFEASLDISQRVSGPSSINAATLLFQLAQALALDHDSKAAVTRMRQAYNIFLTELGADDRNTKEAEGWLEQLTQNAVSIAKHAKDVQARRRFNHHLRPRVMLGMRPQPPAGQSERESQDLVTNSGTRTRGGSLALDERSIDELLRYIEGGDAAKQSRPRKKTANPKRRQQRT